MWSESRRRPAIRVERLSKRYSIGARQLRHRTLRDAVVSSAAAWTRRIRHPIASREAQDNRIWALRDVTLTVPKGAVLGIVGRNGSGKSTLLKILSRVTYPTEGRIEIRGRVGSLLEVGTGFHTELTGRENIFLSGAILGMRRTEIERRFEEIVEFSEVNRFIDTPVKRYSSGMYMKLAFAVAAHLEPHILLVDEVLAVGDAAFQKKCLGRMSDVAGRGRTVLFVSHNIDAVQRLCSECVLLEDGRVVAQGPTPAVVQRYFASVNAQSQPGTWIDLTNRPRRGSGEVRFTAAQFTSFDDRVGGAPYAEGPLTLTCAIETDQARTVGSMAATIETAAGTQLIEADIQSIGQVLRLKRGRNIARLDIRSLHLNPGVYSVRLWIGQTAKSGFDHIASAFQIEVGYPPAGTIDFLSLDTGLVPCAFTLAQEHD